MDLNEKAGRAVIAVRPKLGDGPVHEGCDPRTEAHRGERASAVVSHAGAIHPRLGSHAGAIHPRLGSHADPIPPRLGSHGDPIPQWLDRKRFDPWTGREEEFSDVDPQLQLGQTPVYVGFEPRTETHEERGSRIVVLHVPGFSVEDIKITFENGNNIRVHGERPLFNYRRSRFNQLLCVPPYCDWKEIHAKFVDQKVIITMPNKLQDIGNVSAKNGQEISQIDVNSTADGDKEEENEMTLPREIGIAEPDPLKNVRRHTGKKRKEKSTSKRKNPTGDLDGVTAVILVDKLFSSQDVEKSNNENGDHATNKTNEDDREKCINIGAAILALVAFGAYVGYNFGSSGTSRK